MQSGLGRPSRARAGRHKSALWAAVRPSAGPHGLSLQLWPGRHCANLGQLGNLSEGPHVSVAFESVDGAPPAVFEQVHARAEGGGRHPPDRGGRARPRPTTGCAATSRRRPRAARRRSRGRGMSTTVGSAGRSALNGRGQGRTGAAGWATADDQVLRKIARAGVDQLAAAEAAPQSAPAAAAAETPPPAPKRSSTLRHGSTTGRPRPPEFSASSSDEPKVEIVDAGIELPPPGEVPLPVARPSPGPASERALAFSPND